MALVKALTDNKMESLQLCPSALACGVLKLTEENLQLNFSIGLIVINENFLDYTCKYGCLWWSIVLPFWYGNYSEWQMFGMTLM